MKHAEGSIEGKNHTRIYWQKWVPEDPRAVVVLAHGLGEHSGRYQHVAAALVDIGCAVYAMDHRGHGKSDGPRVLIDKFANVVDDINAVVDVAVSEQRLQVKKIPLFLLGHSMGGALALSYSLKYGQRLSALVLSGPAVALVGAPPMIGPISKLLSFVAPKLGMFAVDPKLVSRDAEEVAAYARDPLNAHGKVPARTLGELVKFIEWLPAALSMIQLPMLVMHGSEDKLAGVSGSKMVVDRAGSRDKTLKIYDGLYHEIFNELAEDRKRVFADMTGWIKSRIP